jgi:pre-rRNA-processing protein IPI1
MPDLQGIKKKKSKGKAKNLNTDFAKKKVKVGRKLERQNETKTTFKIRKLNIAKQSVASDKSGQEVNSRGLTLREILGQISHYSPAVRKEAMSGLKDFFTLHPNTLTVHVGAVFDRVSDIVSDSDPAVRKEFRSLISFLLRNTEKASLQPFLKMYLIYVCSGMSHVQVGTSFPNEGPAAFISVPSFRSRHARTAQRR